MTGFRRRRGVVMVVCALAVLALSVPAIAATREIHNEADLMLWLSGADAGDILLFTPPATVNYLQISTAGSLTGSVNDLTINGGTNEYSGFLLGDGSATILDLSNVTVRSILNIEINNGNHQSATARGGALTAQDILGSLITVAFRNNATAAALGGGAILIRDDLTGDIARNVHFDGNTATAGSGGAIHIGNDFFGSIDGTGSDVHFDRNVAQIHGGGMYVGGNFGNGSSYIYANYFAENQALIGDGGGLYVGGDFNATLRAYSFFDRNKAAVSGGGMYVAGTINGDISGSPVTGNIAAAGDGGGIYANQMAGNIDSGSYFNDNSATAGSGGAIMLAGAGLAAGDYALDGSINANFTGNTAGTDGGAAALGGDMRGDISRSNFINNSAGRDGGAAWFLGNIAGNIDGSAFTGNAAGRHGGAIYFGDGFTGAINDAIFTGNSAGGEGGALYFDTTSAHSYNIVMSAGSGNTTLFDGNRSGSGYNSFYVGGGTSGGDFSLEVTGNGTVALYDPFVVEMNNSHGFTLDQSSVNATLIMSGENLVTTAGGLSTIKLEGGITQVTSKSDRYDDFTMIFGAGSTADITFGSNHTLVISNLPNRQNDLALFDLTNITGNGSTITIEDGSVLDITRLLKPLENNRYLLVSGLDNNLDTVDIQGDFVYLHPDGYTKAPLYFQSEGEIWLDEIEIPDVFDPGVADPNVVSSENCLVKWFHDTEASHSLTTDQILELRKDLASAVPEAAVSLANIGFDVHFMAAESANQAAFGMGGGSWRSVEMAGPAAANPAAGSRSIIAGWSPVDKAARSIVEGANGAIAQLSPGETGPRGFRVWSGYMGGFDRTKEYAGYSGYNYDTHGFLMGLAWDANEAVSFGAYGGYSRTDVDFSEINAEAKANSGHFGLHSALRTVNGFKMVFDASYTHASNNLKRAPAGFVVTRGHVNQDIVGGSANVSYDFELSPAARLTPMASFAGAWLFQKGFDETGSYLASHVRKITARTFHSVAGASIARDFAFGDTAVVTASLGAGWRHRFGDNQFSTRFYFHDNDAAGSTGPGCKIRSRERGRDAALLGASADTVFKTRGGKLWGVKAAYDFEASRKRISHSTFLGAEMRF